MSHGMVDDNMGNLSDRHLDSGRAVQTAAGKLHRVPQSRYHDVCMSVR